MSAKLNHRSWKRSLKPREPRKRSPLLRIGAVCAGFLRLPILPDRTRLIYGMVGFRAWVPLTVLLAVLVGCGESNRAAVNGTVTLDGQPIEDGTINFIPTHDSAASAAWGPIKGGSYSIPAHEGPTVGSSRVEIRWTRKTGKKIPAIAPAPKGSFTEETREAVPVRYNSQSELKRDLQKGENTLDFNLDPK